MNYRNAQDIFPENLLKQIQRYVSGETIYIPAKNDKKAWGESSGYRAYLAKRNQSMKKDFADGLTIEQPSRIQLKKIPICRRSLHTMLSTVLK